MRQNMQAFKYHITINNPKECGYTRDKILEVLGKFNLEYFCLADEVATTGTEHTHIFIYSLSPIRFSTVNNRFPTAHIERAYGTVKQNMEYISKTGKWEKTEKSETVVPNSFYEFGDIPAEGAEKAPIMSQLIKDINDGFTTAQIVKCNPKFGFKVKKIDELRESILSEKYMQEAREQVQVNYYYGDINTNIVKIIFEEHNALDVCRIQNYKNNNAVFDAYHGQPVLVFEDFHSQIPMSMMLNYLDVYPLMLPARYSDRVACYSTVYILSDIPIYKQYIDVQNQNPAIWNEFWNRINSIKYIDENKKTVIYEKEKSNE